MQPLMAEEELRISGISLSEGVACARAYVLESPSFDSVIAYSIEEASYSEEQNRLKNAIQAAEEQLDRLIDDVHARLGAAQANIFVAQKMMLKDPVLLEQMLRGIQDDLINAESVADQILGEYEAQLFAIDNDFMRERVSDITELRLRLLGMLQRHKTGSGVNPVDALFSTDEHRIIVAKELLPSQTIALDPSKTLGFISERGGQASHAAILARALGIPAVSGIGGLMEAIPHGEIVLLDGGNGIVVRRPCQGTLQLYPNALRTPKAKPLSIEPVDGFTVFANISLSKECALLEEVQAEGVGLYRTEFEFFLAGDPLSEDEQYVRYRHVVEAMGGRPLYVRLLDFGGDKPAPFIHNGHEANPFLGFRGARLLQQRPDLLIPQARALARASLHGPIHVIYPMIVDLKQFLGLREMFLQSTTDISGAKLKHGIMFEVPSACLDAEELLSVADCGSIGSNDLIQYLFAVDRGNEMVSHDFAGDRPAFWKLIAHISNAAKAANKPLSLCGEMGGQPEYIPKLITAGIRSVSVSPRMVGGARLAAGRALSGGNTFRPVD